MNKTLILTIAIAVILVIVAVVFFDDNRESLNVVRPTATITNDQGMITNSPTPTTDTTANVVEIALVETDSDDDEAFGCGDAIVYREMDTSDGGGVEIALTSLLELGETDDGYNALADSELEVERIEVSGSQVVVYLTGELSLGGVCDNPRVEEQLVQTVVRNASTNASEETVTIYINDELLDSVLSLQ